MCRDDGGGIDAFIRNAPCAFNYNIYSIFIQCYVMGRFGHENGPFWMLAGAVLVLFPLGPFWSGPFWFQWAFFDLYIGAVLAMGRFGRFPCSRLLYSVSLFAATVIFSLVYCQHFYVAMMSPSSPGSATSCT